MKKNCYKLVKFAGISRLFLMGYYPTCEDDNERQNRFTQDSEILEKLSDFIEFVKNLCEDELALMLNINSTICSELFEDFHRFAVFNYHWTDYINFDDNIIMKEDFSRKHILEDGVFHTATRIYVKVDNEEIVSRNCTRLVLLKYDKRLTSEEYRKEKARDKSIEKQILLCDSRRAAMDVLNNMGIECSDEVLSGIGLSALENFFRHKMSMEVATCGSQISCQFASLVLEATLDVRFSKDKVRRFFREGKFTGSKSDKVYINISDVLSYINQETQRDFFSSIQLIAFLQKKKQPPEERRRKHGRAF